ncbi:MAG: Nif3-like dinuclear metal center hexameric protein [Deltaproteobacteria bacterium]|nr:Nif3-like dinuclear metal center hexameric protein [Deltaproteobacteria bacterium]
MQKITVKNISDFLFRWAPQNLAESWDSVGLQIGGTTIEVRNILVSLDVTPQVLEEAVQTKCNLLITHHPLFFKPLTRLDDSTLVMRLVRRAVEEKINILSFHTNLDSTQDGLNDLLAHQLGLKKIRPLICSEKNNKVGMGRLGSLSRTSLKALLQKLSKKLQISSMRYVGDLNQPIESVAIVTGSGADYFSIAQPLGANVLITSDLKYHTALDALHEGMCIVDIGHFASERGMISLVANRLKTFLSQKSWKGKVYESLVQKDPFQFFYSEV